jgi:hypothetical protein
MESNCFWGLILWNVFGFFLFLVVLLVCEWRECRKKNQFTPQHKGEGKEIFVVEWETHLRKFEIDNRKCCRQWNLPGSRLLVFEDRGGESDPAFLWAAIIREASMKRARSCSKEWEPIRAKFRKTNERTKKGWSLIWSSWLNAVLF